MSEPESKRLVERAGIQVPREKVVGSADDAVIAASQIGFPIVMKAVSAAIPHKSDAGLVILDIASEPAARAAACTLQDRCAALSVTLEGLLVAEQVPAVQFLSRLHR